jgi:exopolysaccharide biosynthesis polyprenyl glycosylphosphotransferase
METLETVNVPVTEIPSRDRAANVLQRHIRRLRATDFAVVIAAVMLAQLAKFGPPGESIQASTFEFSYEFLSVILAFAWCLSLLAYKTADAKVLGLGADEYRRSFAATLRVFGSLAIIAMVFQIDIARSYLALSFPVGAIGLVGSRWLWRKWLTKKRRERLYSSRVLVVGAADDIDRVVRRLDQLPEAGYHVVGAALLDGPATGSLNIAGHVVDVVGPPETIVSAVLRANADAVVVAGQTQPRFTYIRDLGWALEEIRAELIVASELTNIAGPRIHVRPVEGLPLVHVELPDYEGAKLFVKRTADFLVSAAGFIALLPVFVLIAIAIKLDSKGPIFFRQERIGLRGKPFGMWKFRSMVANAQDDLDSVLDAEDGFRVFYKAKKDPRITRLGRTLRRYSIDELPQLINVIVGDMALVGPRPQIQREVDLYDDHLTRRLYVKPGITGLWQVSGRNNLSPDDSARLDLYYVENWSLATDIRILARTLRAVCGSEGAY